MLSVLVAISRIVSCSLAMAPLKLSFTVSYSGLKGWLMRWLRSPSASRARPAASSRTTRSSRSATCNFSASLCRRCCSAAAPCASAWADRRRALGFRHLLGDRRLAEDVERTSHGADLVAPLLMRNGCIQIATGNRLHAAGQRSQDQGNATAEEGTHPDHQQDQRNQDLAEIQQHRPELGLDVMQVKPGADRPVPFGNADHVADLQAGLLIARLDPDIIEETRPRAGGRQCDQLPDDEFPRGVFQVGHVLVGHVLARMRQRQAIFREYKEVIAVFEACGSDCLQRLSLGLFDRQFAPAALAR